MAVACLNQQYFKSGIESQIDPLSKMKYLPENFIVLYRKIVGSRNMDELKDLSHKMIDNTRNLFKAQIKWDQKDSVEPDYRDLAAWYQECSYYFRRLYYYCKHNMPELAFHQSISLQSDLEFLMTDFQMTELDLLGPFDINHLEDFVIYAKLIEQKIISVIEENGIKIETYPTVEDFIQKNS